MFASIRGILTVGRSSTRETDSSLSIPPHLSLVIWTPTKGLGALPRTHLIAVAFVVRAQLAYPAASLSLGHANAPLR
jgi:hypothetical protein